MKISTDTGRLNQRITIQCRKTVYDEIGNQTSEWTDFHSCWAAVNGVSGREYREARQQNAENTVNFKIRYCKKLAELEPVGFRILFRGKIYNITSIDNQLFANDLINIKGAAKSEQY